MSERYAYAPTEADRQFCAGMGDRWAGPENLRALYARAWEAAGGDHRYTPEHTAQLEAGLWIMREDRDGNDAPFVEWVKRAPLYHSRLGHETALEYFVDITQGCISEHAIDLAALEIRRELEVDA